MRSHRDERGFTGIELLQGLAILMAAAGVVWGAGAAFNALDRDVGPDQQSVAQTPAPVDPFIGPAIPAEYSRDCVKDIAVGYGIYLSENGWRSSNDAEPDPANRTSYEQWKAKVSAEAQRAATEWRERCKPSQEATETPPPPAQSGFSGTLVLTQQNLVNQAPQSTPPCAGRSLPRSILVEANPAAGSISFTPAGGFKTLVGRFDGSFFEIKYADGDLEWSGTLQLGRADETRIHGEYYTGGCTITFTGERGP
jgi:hypothetical protein